MDTADRILLESKLKRYRIRHSYEHGILKIRSAKTDYLSILGLILFPGLFGLGLVAWIIYALLSDDAHMSFIKMVLFAIALFGVAGVNIKRLYRKHRDNNQTKVFSHGSLKIEQGQQRLILSPLDIDQILTFTEELSEDLYQGRLIIFDIHGHRHVILSLDGDNKYYVETDLRWFRDFVARFFGIEDPD